MIMRLRFFLKSIMPFFILLAACTSSTCPDGALSYLEPPFPPENTENVAVPQLIEIGRQEIQVDEVISGELCNDSWSGTVYVTCNLEVPAWEEEPLFWQDCDLNIAEGTVVYVEAHGDQPYFEGCSCHE
jgi:hypothetical protein